MKVAGITFLIFFIIDFILFVVLSNFNYGKNMSLFLPAIFLEIAVYDSLLLYEVSKKNKDN